MLCFQVSFFFFCPNDNCCSVVSWAQGCVGTAHFIPLLSLVAKPQKRKKDCTTARWESYSCILRQTRVTAPRELGFGVLAPHSREQQSSSLANVPPAWTDEATGATAKCRCATGGTKSETDCKALRVKQCGGAVLDEAI